MVSETFRAGDDERGRDAEGAAETVKQEGQSALDSAREAGKTAAERRKSDAADFLRDVSSAIHCGADELRGKQYGQVAEYVDRAADGLAGIGSDLDSRDIGELLDRVNEFAHRQPALTAALGLAAGFAIVRFARSGRDHPANVSSGPAQGTSSPHEIRQ